MLTSAVSNTVKCNITVTATHNVIQWCIIGIKLTPLVVSGFNGYKLFCEE